jgi:excisionase family DNA binding protein
MVVDISPTVWDPNDHNRTNQVIGEKMSEKILLSPEEAAERLGIGRTRIFHLIRDGEINSVKVGRLRRIPAYCLDEFVAALINEGVPQNDPRK